jgi:hypothetical protein
MSSMKMTTMFGAAEVEPQRTQHATAKHSEDGKTWRRALMAWLKIVLEATGAAALQL